MVEKRSMHRLSDGVVPSKGERDIAHPAANARRWQVFLNPAHGRDEVHRVVIVLLHAGRNRQDIWIENDILRWKPNLLRQNSISSGADLFSPGKIVRLTLLVERHYH